MSTHTTSESPAAVLVRKSTAIRAMREQTEDLSVHPATIAEARERVAVARDDLDIAQQSRTMDVRMFARFLTLAEETLRAAMARERGT